MPSVMVFSAAAVAAATKPRTSLAGAGGSTWRQMRPMNGCCGRGQCASCKQWPAIPMHCCHVQVFATIPPDVAFDIEVKMATPDDLAVTPAEEVRGMMQPTHWRVGQCRAGWCASTAVLACRRVQGRAGSCAEHSERFTRWLPMPPCRTGGPHGQCHAGGGGCGTGGAWRPPRHVL